jgi:hypothetical protein
MIGGLKAYLPRLAEIAGSTPASLYERQRALVRLGLLSAQPGRGPGSGVKLSPDSLAIMIISILATENLSEIDKRVLRLCNARPTPEPTCNVTGGRTLREALTMLLASPSFSREGHRLIGLSVDRPRSARISLFERGTETRSTRFEAASDRSSRRAMIHTTAAVDSDLFRLIVADLAALLPPPPSRPHKATGVS